MLSSILYYDKGRYQHKSLHWNLRGMILISRHIEG